MDSRRSQPFIQIFPGSSVGESSVGRTCFHISCILNIFSIGVVLLEKNFWAMTTSARLGKNFGSALSLSPKKFGLKNFIGDFIGRGSKYDPRGSKYDPSSSKYDPPFCSTFYRANFFFVVNIFSIGVVLLEKNFWAMTTSARLGKNFGSALSLSPKKFGLKNFIGDFIGRGSKYDPRGSKYDPSSSKYDPPFCSTFYRANFFLMTDFTKWCTYTFHSNEFIFCRPYAA